MAIAARARGAAVAAVAAWADPTGVWVCQVIEWVTILAGSTGRAESALGEDRSIHHERLRGV
jgi:hypothetical protein